MKFTTLDTAWGSAALLLAAQPCLATSQHRQHHHHLSKRHGHSHNNSARQAGSVATCSFPTDQGLVAVTPHMDNAGWALSPDQLCATGSYCPYACPSGEVMAQWKDGSSYATTDRMAGGLFCGLDGNWVKPFSNKPLCVPGVGNVKAVNKAGKVCSFCQTVLPGNEDILIPNDVVDSTTLAVPDTTYWQGTAAHYYVNAPGVDADTGCHWGDSSKPIGNWAPYVAGMNTDASGLTYVKLGRNPIWESSALFGTKPTFGLKIECDGVCVGMPCSVDGNGVTSNLAAIGAGGADFCIVTVPKGSSASIVVYNLDGSSGSTTTTKALPTSSAVPTYKASAIPTTHTTSTTTVAVSTSYKVVPTSTSVYSSAKPTSARPSGYSIGGIFQENGTSSSSFSWAGPSSTSTPTANTDSSSTGAATTSETTKNQSSGPAHQGNAAIAGLIIALVAAGCIL